MAAAAILDVVQNPAFTIFSVKYVTMVLRFKFHRNQAINGRVMHEFVKLKMATAAILNSAQNPDFTIFQ